MEQGANLISAFRKKKIAITIPKLSSSVRLETEPKAKVEAQRMYELIDVDQQHLKIKGQAMHTVKQSEIANQKSYEAGVRSTTDVLLAIQTFFQVRNEYAQATAQQANQQLNLLLVVAEDPDRTVKLTQPFCAESKGLKITQKCIHDCLPPNKVR